MKNIKNYSVIQIILFIIQFFSPLIIVFSFDWESTGLSVFGKLAVSCLITAIIVIAFFSDKSKNVATGRSFKTKSGIQLDEYSEEITRAPEPADFTMNIVFIHLGITLIVFVKWLLSTF